MKIAVSGKGGVGKTTISAGLVHCCNSEGFPVYAIDADPDASLGITLGLDPGKLEQLVPLIEMKEVIEDKNAGGGLFVDLNPAVDDILADYCLCEGNIRFIRMGGIKQGGSACYCKENSFLHSILTSLLLERKEAVVLDMSAGIEHLTRGTARGVDMMLVVTEPSIVSVKTAALAEKLARELGIRQVFLLGNKVRDDGDRDFLESSLTASSFIGMIPFNEKLLLNSRVAGDGSKGYLLNNVKDIWQEVRKKALNQ